MTRIRAESWERFHFVSLYLYYNPPLEPRVPKKHPVGPFSVPFWKVRVTSALLKYMMLSPEQGGEGGGLKRGKDFLCISG